MRPLADLPAGLGAGIQGVLFDIDDTLTTEGKLTARAYAAMEQLQHAGKLVVPITGRPAGWCDHIARMWPVDGVVGENGAFYFAHDAEGHRLVKRYITSEPERIASRAKLSAICERILREIPGTAVASDQRYREADLAIDYCEDVPRLADAEIDRIVRLMEDAGMKSKVSSIHVNGWFGDYDKLGMTRILMRERFGVDLDAVGSSFVFIGDSPNDAPMFDYFPYSIGVANVRDFLSRLTTAPKYVTRSRCGMGFAEVASLLLGTGVILDSEADV
jgi:HAD superfamily hydrolase (TIGR01484 family)